MPYRTDSSVFSNHVAAVVDYTGAARTYPYTLGRQRTQRGFRSGPLSQAERAGTDGRRDRTWKDSLQVIQGYEYEYNSRPSRQSSRVNERDYTEYTSFGMTTPWRSHGFGVPTSGIAAYGCETVLPAAGTVFPPLASAIPEAASLMRSSVPTAPAVDLVRSLVELKDFPRALRSGNYFLQTGRDYASAYLNQVFGLQPTGKDLAAIANVALESTPIVERFVAHERHALRRSRTKEMGSFRHNQIVGFSGTTQRTAIRVDGRTWGSVWCASAPYGYSIVPGIPLPLTEAYVNIDARAEVRSFATFEYFIPRPTGITGRLDVYRRKAEQVLGSGLSASAVYELSPWSWMIDWFIDIGGLLRYQESVASNSVVASRSGYVYETTSTLTASIRPSSTAVSNKIEIEIDSPPLFIAPALSSVRRAGGPYGILSPWSLTANQAAVVGALAVGRYSPF